jgi:hypothetical protein
MREGSSQESSLRGAGERMTVNDLFTLIFVPFFGARFLSHDPERDLPSTLKILPTTPIGVSGQVPQRGGTRTRKGGTRTLQGESLQDEPQRGRMSPIKGGEV